MKIGIIVYSQTGNTLSIAEKLKEKLSAAGHEAAVERVEPAGDVHPGMKNPEYSNKPDVTPYEGVVFASPVQAFSLAVGMKGYLSQVASLEGKKTAFFVTKQLPFKWTGANQAIGFMKRTCQAKGAAVLGGETIFWGKPDRDEQVTSLLESIADMFS